MNRINFINYNFSEYNLSKINEKECCFSFLLRDIKDFKNISLKTLHSFDFYSQHNCKFSFYIDKTSNDKLLELTKSIIADFDFLCQLFFHPQFESKHGIPVVFMHRDLVDNVYVVDFINLIRECSVNQGFDDVIFEFIGENPNGKVSICFNDHSLESFLDRMSMLIEDKFYVSRYISFFEPNIKFCSEVFTLTDLIFEKIKTNKPELYDHLFDYHYYKNELSNMIKKFERTNEDLVNQKTYLKLIKEADESKKINEFYYYEYEILPLWYKKLGHIIKVISGKRNWRSLFNNNVKKY